MNSTPIEAVQKQAAAVRAHYTEDLRALLVDHDPDSVVVLDHAAKTLDVALARVPHLSIGFLGASQVGKSSIINALLGTRALPSGGVGPLTAQATRVLYRDTSSFEARFHGRERLNQVAFALRPYVLRGGVLDADEHTDGDVVAAALEAGSSGETGAAEQARTVSAVCEDLLQSVRLMLKQDDLPDPDTLPATALLDAVRLCLNQAPHTDGALLDPWKPAIVNIRARLSESEQVEEDENARKEFRQQLRLRAAGWMSPLIDQLIVHLRRPVLQGLELVDLPGIANFADAGGHVATEFVRRRDAGALALVVRNNLMDASVNDLLMQVLERYGLIERLLWGRTDNAMPLTLLFLVTNVDNVARERWARLAEDADEDDDPPDQDEVFEEVAGEIEVKLRTQVKKALTARMNEEDSDDAQRARVQRAIEDLEQRIKVLCVSAPDYLAISDKRGGQSFVQRMESTNIPALQTLLRELVEERQERQRTELEASAAELHCGLAGQLAILEREYGEGGGPATAVYERFRESLEDTRSELSEQLAAGRHAAGRALDHQVVARIDDLLQLAAEAGHKRLKRIRRKAADLHWSSLNAALSRNGAWTTGGGRTIDYPTSLTKAISEQIAGGWDDMVIGGVRETTRALIHGELHLVEELCARALELDAKLVQQEHIDEQKALLRNAANSTVRWTRERLADLTEEVEARLRDEVGPPIDKVCASAVRAGRNRGTGAKQRIIQTFEDGGERAVDAAVAGARTVLLKECRKVVAEIRSTYLRDGADPLQRTFDQLTHSEARRAQGADARHRKNVLATLVRHREALAAVQPGTAQGAA